MRTIDRRTQLGRRALLGRSATILPAAALASAGITIAPEAAWAQQAKSLPPEVMATLVRMARDIFPHDHIADAFYIRAAAPWDDKAGTDPAFKTLLVDGVARLDADSRDRHAQPFLRVPWEVDRVRLLQGIERTPFFRKLRGDLVISLYNQEEIWPKFGYEGSSAEHGGYLHRGFDDIDWLPAS